MNDLIKIQQDMASPKQQHQQRQKVASVDEEDASVRADPNDWIADLPGFGLYHRGYTTSHWLQVFRPL